MVFLPSSNSDLSRALNFSRGRSRKSAARRTSGLTLASTFAGLPSDRASSASTARFSCSTFFASPFGGFRERLGIGTLHARPQARQRAELQLLHRAFGLANLPRHFLNAFLFHKPQHHHALLLSGQRVDQPKQSCPPFHFFELSVAGRRGVDQSRLVRHLLSIRALPAIRNEIRRNPVEPRRKRNPPPLKPLQIGQRMMKNLGGQILGLRAIPHPPHYIRVHPLEIILVKLRKARRILLRRLDQKPLVRLAFFVPSRQSLQTDSPRGVVLHRDNGREEEKLRSETGAMQRPGLLDNTKPGALFLASSARNGREHTTRP